MKILKSVESYCNQYVSEVRVGSWSNLGPIGKYKASSFVLYKMSCIYAIPHTIKNKIMVELNECGHEQQTMEHFGLVFKKNLVDITDFKLVESFKSHQTKHLYKSFLKEYITELTKEYCILNKYVLLDFLSVGWQYNSDSLEKYFNLVDGKLKLYAGFKSSVDKMIKEYESNTKDSVVDFIIGYYRDDIQIAVTNNRLFNYCAVDFQSSKMASINGLYGFKNKFDIINGSANKTIHASISQQLYKDLVKLVIIESRLSNRVDRRYNQFQTRTVDGITKQFLVIYNECGIRVDRLVDNKIYIDFCDLSNGKSKSDYMVEFANFLRKISVFKSVDINQGDSFIKLSLGDFYPPVYQSSTNNTSFVCDDSVKHQSSPIEHTLEFLDAKSKDISKHIESLNKSLVEKTNDLKEVNNQIDCLKNALSIMANTKMTI